MHHQFVTMPCCMSPLLAVRMAYCVLRDEDHIWHFTSEAQCTYQPRAAAEPPQTNDKDTKGRETYSCRY